jgi:prevent-host-death family protein
MAVKQLSAQEARESFADVLGTVYYRKEPVLIRKRGRIVAVVVSPEDFALLESQKDRAFSVMDRIAEKNLGKTEEEVYRDVTEAVEAVRQELYEERKKAA